MPNPDPGGDAPDQVRVWDGLVRLVHWSLAFLVLVNFINEDGAMWHRYAGYAGTMLVLTRLAWSACSPGYARFSRWRPTLSGLASYLRAMRAGMPPRYLGLNPVGATMALLLWGLVLALGISGWMMGLDAFFGEEWLQLLHAALAYGLLACATLHVLSVLTMSVKHRENLPKAMLTGKKRRT